MAARSEEKHKLMNSEGKEIAKIAADAILEDEKQSAEGACSCMF